MSEGIVVVNFSHPLTEAQQAQVAALAGQPVARVIDVPAQVDVGRELAPQAAALLDGVPLSAEEWQTLPLLINPPGLAVLTAALLAEVHGRTGHFPTLIRLRPVEGAAPRYEVAELLNLQAVRDRARTRRWAAPGQAMSEKE